MRKILSLFLAVVFAAGGLFLWAGAASAADAETRYATKDYARGGSVLYTVNETINYHSKNVSASAFAEELPGYLSSYTCGITAGGIVIGYYDRQYENLIPNHDAGEYIWGVWFWNAADNEVDDMYDSLYTKMGATSAGVTIAGYKSGMTSYVSGKSKTMSFTQVYNSGALDSSYKTALAAGKPLTVFVDGFNLVNFAGYQQYTGYDTIKTQVASGAHVMIAYGYVEIEYRDSSNAVIQTETFLYVHTGFSSPRFAYLRVSKFCTLDDAYVSHIY